MIGSLFEGSGSLVWQRSRQGLQVGQNRVGTGALNEMYGNSTTSFFDGHEFTHPTLSTLMDFPIGRKGPEEFSRTSFSGNLPRERLGLPND
jgi:hypothetical protein